MKNLLLIAICLFTLAKVSAQNAVKKGDVIIHLTGYDAWVEHQFDLDIMKEGKSLKIKYTYCDSIKFSEVRKDPEFRRLNDISVKYEPGTPTRRLISDSLGLIIEKHKAYTRDSVTLNLKTETEYRNLLQRVVNTDKETLTPKMDPKVLDGYSIFIRIITEDKNLFTAANNPELKTHALLFSLITETLDENKNSNTVQKIRKYYPGF